MVHTPDHPRFPILAAGFGTHDSRRILRAMMLERFLLARAAQNRDIEPEQPPGPAEPADIEALELKLRPPSQPRPKPRQKTDPDDPRHFALPTLKELESQIRRRSVGRTIAEICADLGVTPSLCDGATWSEPRTIGLSARRIPGGGAVIRARYLLRYINNIPASSPSNGRPRASAQC